MFDSVKIEIVDAGLMERVRSKTGLSVLTALDTETGETTRQTTQLLNLRLTGHASGRTVLQGSLHRYANGGQHNADAFTHERFCRTVGELADLLEVDPATAKISALEAGVNLYLSTNPLPRIIAYKGKPPDVRTFGGKGNERRWDFEAYTLKGYDKARQYHLPDPVTRWEVGTGRMRYLNAYGLNVATLADLTNPQRVEAFGPLLADLFAELTFADLTDFDRLTNAERKFYKQAATFQFWERINNRKERSYARQRFDSIRAKYGANERERIAELIRRTWEDLLHAPTRNLDIFTDPGKLEFGTFSPFKYIVNSSYLPALVSPSANLPPYRVCKTCGADISHRQPGAVFCERKQCRNQDSNPRNNLRRRVGRALEAPLFDPVSVIRLTSEQTQLLAY